MNLFLMHRVELKAASLLRENPVPSVPNAPCGVESMITFIFSLYLPSFLMHRVELKDGIEKDEIMNIAVVVPNAPCGVESG